MDESTLYASFSAADAEAQPSAKIEGCTATAATEWVCDSGRVLNYSAFQTLA